MKTIRRLIYLEVAQAVGFVSLGFLALFFFFDFVDEIGGGKPSRMGLTLLYVASKLPAHVYELLPIAVLIGTIFVMARLAQSSEYTILRTSGLGPWRALRALLVLGLGFALLTFAVGDYVAPYTNQKGQLVKARMDGVLTLGTTGAWLKERQPQASYNVNVRLLTPEGRMRLVRIFEADSRGMMVSMTGAALGSFEHGAWQLEQVSRTEFDQSTGRIKNSYQPSMRWPTEITQEMVSVALLKPERMSTIALFQYIQHLEANSQSAQRYEIEFWRKVFYPLSCLVMVVLALPFAYLHFRTGGITSYVFVGVLIGISFFLLNNLFGYIGNLHNWVPWVAAGLPGLFYTLVSLAAFGFLVLRR